MQHSSRSDEDANADRMEVCLEDGSVISAALRDVRRTEAAGAREDSGACMCVDERQEDFFSACE